MELPCSRSGTQQPWETVQHQPPDPLDRHPPAGTRCCHAQILVTLQPALMKLPVLRDR